MAPLVRQYCPSGSYNDIAPFQTGHHHVPSRYPHLRTCVPLPQSPAHGWAGTEVCLDPTCGVGVWPTSVPTACRLAFWMTKEQWSDADNHKALRTGVTPRKTCHNVVPVLVQNSEQLSLLTNSFGPSSRDDQYVCLNENGPQAQRFEYVTPSW